MFKKIATYIFLKLNARLKDASKKAPVFPLSEKIKIGSNFIIGHYRNIQVEKGAELVIEDSVGFREFCNIIVLKGATLKIGRLVFCNNYVSINCMGKISIGEKTLIGEGVKMYDHSHKYAYNNNELTVERYDFKISEINIGSNVWIGSNSTILNGVTIGDNVIIGANNLIYKSVPSGTIIKAKVNLLIDNIGEGQ